MCIRDSVSVDSFLPLKMSASGTAETSGLIENLGPLPNRPAVNFNSNATGRKSLQKRIIIITVYVLNVHLQVD